MICGTATVLHLADGFDLRPATAADAETVAHWMAQPHIQPWWNQDWPADRWASTLTELAAGEHSIPCVATLDGQELGYLEVYRVRHDRLAEYYASAEHDWGVHVALGGGRVGRGIGRRLLRAVADALLAADLGCDRVVAEPDIRNGASVRAFAAAGFTATGELRLPEKTAMLMVRTRTLEA